MFTSLANSESLSSSLLLGKSKSWLVGLSNSCVSFDAVEFDVTVRREVRGNTTMGAVGSSTTLLGSLNNNVSNDAFVSVETFLLSVCLQVEEQLADGLDRLLGPSAGGGALDLALGVS